jgi:hypothetical protein
MVKWQHEKWQNKMVKCKIYQKCIICKKDITGVQRRIENLAKRFHPQYENTRGQ